MRAWLKYGGMAACALLASTALAADHTDSAGPTAEPAADINDVFTWMEGDNLVLIMTVQPFADAGAAFSDAVTYTFHVDAHPAFGQAAGMQSEVACTFDAAGAVTCAVNGDEAVVSGDATDTAGLENAAQNMKVFTGRRADPFYFYLTGYNTAVATVVSAASLLTFQASGCPIVDGVTSNTLVSQLTAGNGNLDNDFAGADVMALVVEIDKSLVTDATNDVVSVWARTYVAAEQQ
jgi:hypothetical protein